MAKRKNSNEGWKDFFEANSNVLDEISRKGLCKVTASQIKDYREPRLMTKHDSIDSVPKPLTDRKLNVLSASKNEYYIGDFNVFKNFPEKAPHEIISVEPPAYETLNAKSITSEANAINALTVCNILDDFLEEDGIVQTFNGRMRSSSFDFNIQRYNGGTSSLSIENAQMEIDAGFESYESVIILEAKNIIHDDFNIKQLYYPYRKYKTIATKPIRLIFSQYSNLKYNLYEYSFANPNDFSSICLLKQKSYIFEDQCITQDEIYDQCRETKVIYDDCADTSAAPPPFPQADSIDRILSVIEFLSSMPNGEATKDEVVAFMGLTERQADYYPTAGQYLKLIDRPRRGLIKLTQKGAELLKLEQRSERLLKFVSHVFEHRIFNELYLETIHNGRIPNKQKVITLMKRYRVLKGTEGKCSESTYSRRAQTVIKWIEWISSLADEE